MRKTYGSLLTALTLLTRIPVPLRFDPEYALFPLFMPVLGVLFSAAIIVIYTAAAALFSGPVITAAAVLISQYLMFNLFHFDGLLDSADALLYNTTPDKRLEILKDKSAGSFAVFAGVLYLIIKSALVWRFVSLQPGPASAAAFFAYIAAGRIAGGIVPAVSSPARETGLGALLTGYNRRLFAAGSSVSITVVFTAVHFMGAEGTPGLLIPSAAGFLAAVLTGTASGLIFKKKAGGFTGDAVGMAVELGELIYMAVFIELVFGHML